MNKRKVLCFMLMSVVTALMTSGCLRQSVPSQYDLKLKTKEKELTCRQGGNLETMEITIDSRRYQELSSDEQIFLSYHLLDSESNLLIQDGIRTRLTPIAARGVKTEAVTIKTPLEKGDYMVVIDLVEEGVTWFSSQGMETLKIPLKVENSTEPNYPAIVLNGDTLDLEYNSAPISHSPIAVTIQNYSGIALCSTGSEAVFLSYLVKDSAGIVIAEGERIPLPENIPSDTTATISFLPQTELFTIPGEYTIELDLLMEQETWFKELGVTPLTISVTVKK